MKLAILSLFTLFLFMGNSLFAQCGSCEADKLKRVTQSKKSGNINACIDCQLLGKVCPACKKKGVKEQSYSKKRCHSDDKCKGKSAKCSGDDKCKGKSAKCSGDDKCKGKSAKCSGDDKCKGKSAKCSGDDKCKGKSAKCCAKKVSAAFKRVGGCSSKKKGFCKSKKGNKYSSELDAKKRQRNNILNRKIRHR